MADIYDWSTTAADNDDADSTINWLEGQLPGTVNGSARAMMKRVKELLNDLTYSGTVGGTADAITLTSAIGALADNKVVTFKAGADNTGAATLAVNGLTAKAIRKISSGTDVALSAGDIEEAVRYVVVYDSAANSSAGAWIIVGSSASVAAATTSAAGILKLATLARTLAGTVTDEAVPPAHLYFPTGHLYGLTLTNAAGDATNDITIAAGTARDASDSYNYVLGSAYTKQIDAAWALGSAAGGLDTGSVGNSRYAIWGIGRSDTRVCDVLFSTSFSAPTMPANYDFKVLIGEFTRAGGTNGTPLWYGPRKASSVYAGANLSLTTASTSGTAIDYTGLPGGIKEISINLAGVSLNGSAGLLIQIGDSGSIETTGYTCQAVRWAAGGSADATSTSGALFQTGNAGALMSGAISLKLVDPATNMWAIYGLLKAGSAQLASTCDKALSGVLDRVRITTSNGTDAFDAGLLNIMYKV